MRQASNRLGVVIPTRNSEGQLATHLDAIHSWLDLVSEVVVVDSESTDATLEIVGSRLADERVRILKHPPGLYASWNHGVAHLNTKWTYIATVGDTIDRSGVSSLLDAAEQLDCDVVCSPPKWVWPDVRSQGKASSTPVDEMVAELGISSPVRLERSVLVAYCAVFALCRGLNTPLCSSASDLYRTDTLKRSPFPVQHGSAGDAFWLLEHASRLRYGIVPQRLATFLAHPSQHAPVAGEARALRYRQAAELCSAGVERLARQNEIVGQEQFLLKQLIEACWSSCQAEQEFERLRSGPWKKAWVLRPRSWQTRRRRDTLRSKAERARRDFLSHVLEKGNAITAIP